MLNNTLRFVIPTIASLMIASHAAAWTTIATQGFETAVVVTGGDGNYDLAATDSSSLALGSSLALPNTDDDGDTGDLTFVTALPVLGYSTTYTNTRDDVGLSDGDFIGPTAFTGDVGAFDEGTQGFQFDDPDGALTLTFDALDISAYPMGVSVSLAYFIEDTGYESDDLLTISVDVDGTSTTLLNFVEADLEAAPEEWTDLTTGPLIGSSLTISILNDNNSGAETFYLDDVVVTAVPEPDPAVMFLLAVAMLGFAIRPDMKK